MQIFVIKYSIKYSIAHEYSKSYIRSHVIFRHWDSWLPVYPCITHIGIDLLYNIDTCVGTEVLPYSWACGVWYHGNWETKSLKRELGSTDLACNFFWSTSVQSTEKPLCYNVNRLLTGKTWREGCKHLDKRPSLDTQSWKWCPWHCLHLGIVTHKQKVLTKRCSWEFGAVAQQWVEPILSCAPWFLSLQSF